MEITRQVVEAFCSSAYDEGEVRRRLERYEASKTSDAAARTAVHQLGAALVAESETRARDAVDLVLDQIDWNKAAAKETTCKPLSLLIGGRTLLQLSQHDLTFLLRVSRPPRDAKLGRALVHWLEYGIEAAYEHACQRLGSTSDIERELVSLHSVPVIRGRVSRLLASRLGDEEAQVRWLAARLGHYGIIESGAHAIAAEKGLSRAVSPGLTCSRGGRSDLHVYEAKPLLEVAWHLDRELFYEIVPGVLKSPWINNEQTPHLLDFIPWEEDQQIWTETEQYRAWRVDRLVFTHGGKHGKGGSVSVKVHKTADKACKDHHKKLAAKAQKLGAAASDPHEEPGAQQQLDEQLLQASTHCQRDCVARLLAAGADPSAAADDGWTCLHRTRGDDAETVRLLLEAGADCEAKTTPGGLTPLALFAGESQTWWQVVSIGHLLRAGAKDTRRANGWTPLLEAARRGFAEAVALMLEHRFDPSVTVAHDAVEHPGKTALDLAIEGEHHGTIALLRDHGAKRSSEL